MWGERMAKEFKKGPFNHEKCQSNNDTAHDQEKHIYILRTSGEMLAAFVTPKLLGIQNSCCIGAFLICKDTV